MSSAQDIRNLGELRVTMKFGNLEYHLLVEERDLMHRSYMREGLVHTVTAYVYKAMSHFFNEDVKQKEQIARLHYRLHEFIDAHPESARELIEVMYGK